ncbi:Uncharacterised protein [Bordetella pertussis]|nr:Uncharacterised protein [Bordetella pertussis]CFW49779.1 Uncharacterised protein [Bordetella pertussis]
MWLNFAPVRRWNSTRARCGGVPKPLDPTLSTLPDFAALMMSCTLL